MFNPNNFISEFSSYDILIKILDTSGSISFSFSVCNYQNCSLNEDKILIFFQSKSTPKELEFESREAAIIGLERLRNAVNLLKNNCNASDLQNNNPSVFWQGEQIVKTFLERASQSSLIINWHYDDNFSYEIEYLIHGDLFSLKRIRNINAGTYTLNNLENNQVYEIKIKKTSK